MPIADTIKGFKEIAEGKHDGIPEQAFYLQGTIEEALENAENHQAVKTEPVAISARHEDRLALPTKLTLNIVTPDHSHSSRRRRSGVAGSEGFFGVLPGHTPMFAGLKTGIMWYRQGQQKHFLAVSVGFAEVLPDRVTVLAQVAESAEDFDEARVEAG